jgi:hypothetical protein
MANTTQDMVFESFAEAASGATQSLNSMASAAKQSSVPLLAHEETNSKTPSSGGGGSEALTIATTVLESGLGIVPLVAGLIGLFTGGGDSNAPPPLMKYVMPDKTQFLGADTGSGMSDVDYDQMGMPRAYSGTPNGVPSANAAAVAGSSTGASGVTTPQIQVNVQAMDARSFLDHSSEIAQAVRTAMLNLNSLNDVVSDL